MKCKMDAKSFTLSFLVWNLFVQNAWAADPVERWYLQPTLTQIQPTSDYLIKNRNGFGIGKTLVNRFNLEVSLFADSLNRKNTDPYQADILLVEGKYLFKNLGSITPYLAGGISQQYTSRKNLYSNNLSNVGFGILHRQSKGITLRADLRYFSNDPADEPSSSELSREDWSMSLGVSIPLKNWLFR